MVHLGVAQVAFVLANEHTEGKITLFDLSHYDHRWNRLPWEQVHTCFGESNP